MDDVSTKMKNMKITKTILCHSVTKPGRRCKNQLCCFAHNIEELRPAKCKFGNRCNKGSKCTHIHKGESKKEFADRHGFRSRNKLRKPMIQDTLNFARSVTKKLQAFMPIDTNNNIGASIMKRWGWVETDKLEIPEFKLSNRSFYNESLPRKNITDKIVFVKGGIQQ